MLYNQTSPLKKIKKKYKIQSFKVFLGFGVHPQFTEKPDSMYRLW